MEFCYCAAQDGHCFLEIFKLDDIFNCVADKMYNIRQIKYGWNFFNKKLTKEPSIPSAVAHRGTYARASNQVDNLLFKLSLSCNNDSGLDVPQGQMI